MTNNSNTVHPTLGSVLEAARQEADLSLRRLSALSGVHTSSINRLLKDQIDQPVPEHLIRLAEALELNAADLFVLAGLPLPERLPSLDVMLRAEYGLPPEAIEEAKRDIGRIIEKYDGGAKAGRR